MIRRILILALVALMAIAGPAAAQYDPGSGCGSVSVTNPVTIDADGTAVVAAGGDATLSLSNMLPGSTVTVTVGGLSVASFTVPASGVLAGSFQIPAGLGDGTYTIVASGSDANGNACGASTAVRISSGTVGGGGGGGGEDDGGSISVPNPNAVDPDGTPVVSVGADVNVVRTGLLPGSTLTITLDGVVVGTVTVPASGDVSTSIQVPAGTTLGTHTVTASGTNADGTAAANSLDIRVTSASQNAAGGNDNGGNTGGTTGGNTDPSSSLAFTGSTAGPLAGAATVLIVLGAVIMLQARKPENTDS